MTGTGYTEWISYPEARIRVELETVRGEVRRFVVQLEYERDDGWQPVVRFDHDPDAEHGHDVTQEGLHMDVFRDGEKYRVERGFPPVSLSHASGYCQWFINERAERLLERFEEWHDLDRR